MMLRVNGKVLLRDNRDISAAEFEAAQAVCARIQHWVESREAYIRDHHLDRTFCLPDGLWSPTAFNDYLNTFREVSAGRYEVINRLRLFVSFFSGYSLRRVSGVPGKPSFEPLSPDLDEQIAALIQEPDPWVHRWLRLAARVPDDRLFSPPKLLGEVGWDVSGVVVNHDTCVYQERINLMHHAGLFDWLHRRLAVQGKLRVLEIGAGYGALGYQIKKMFAASDYWICDLPESLLYSALYLSIIRPDCKAGFGEEASYGFTYMPNYLIDRIAGKFDLVINTLSFSEMSEHQLRTYAEKIAELLGDGMLFEQNQDNRHVGLLCAQDILRDYFPAQRPITSGLTWRVTQGCANLWANRSASLPPAAKSRPWRCVQDVAHEGSLLLGRLKRAVLNK